MVDLFTVGLFAQLASGVAILGLGLALFAVRPRRDYTLSFGFFLVIWGGLILAGNLATLALDAGDMAQAREWMLFQVACLTAVYLPLAHFGVTFTSSADDGVTPVQAAALVAPALIGAALLLWDPTLFHEGFAGEAASAFSIFGPLYPVYTALFTVTMWGVILGLFLRSGKTSGIQRQRATYVIIAFLLLEIFGSVEDVILFGNDVLQQGAGASVSSWAFAGLGVVGLGFGATIGVRLARDEELSARFSPWVRWGALALPVAFGAISASSRVIPGATPILTLGLWRFAAVGLIVYAILRFELFGVTSRAPDWLGVIGISGLLLALALGLNVLVTGWLGSVPIGFLLSQVLLWGGLLWMARQHPALFDPVLRVVGSSDRTPAMSPRALEVYEAELARNQPGGRAVSAPTSGHLGAIRTELSITEGEHATLARLVQGDSAPTGRPIESGVALGGRYELGAKLGEGAHSEVYEATDRKTGQRVAVKLLEAEATADEQATRRFLREARIARDVDHPNVVPVLETGFDLGRPFLVLDLAEGGNLADRIAREGPLDLEEVLQVLDGVLAGLAHLHARGFVHGDIKPKNVLLSADGDGRIGDLGIAQDRRPDRTRDPAEVAPGAGTPLYMAPEVLNGRPTTPQADLYAVGAVLYEAVTGEHYLGLEDARLDAVHRAVKARPPRKPSLDVPADLASVWERSLAKAPGDRFSSAGEMRDALHAAVESAPRAVQAPAEEEG